jgi:hypothetical protein
VAITGDVTLSQLEIFGPVRMRARLRDPRRMERVTSWAALEPRADHCDDPRAFAEHGSCSLTLR